MRARQLAGDDPGIAVDAVQLRQPGARFRSERHFLSASLGVRQLDAIVVDAVSAEHLDFGHSAARQQQPEGGEGRGVNDQWRSYFALPE